MSRHRIVRRMNYEDEYPDDEDEYSKSLEDKYCISPSTAEQFTWNRERKVDIAAFMGGESVIDEEEAEEDEANGSLNDSASRARMCLSATDQARLNSCLEELRNILGDSVPEPVMVDVIIKNGFNLESSLNLMLSPQDAPKPQREPRTRRDRSQASSQASTQNGSNNSVQQLATPDHACADSPAVSVKMTVVDSPATVVTPKSTKKPTVGFEAQQNILPSSLNSKNPGLKLKVENASESPLSTANTTKTASLATDPVASSSPRTQNIESTRKTKNVSSTSKTTLPVDQEEGTGTSCMDQSLQNAVEFMGLDGDKEVIQSSMDAMRPAAATPKAKSKRSKLDVMSEYTKRNGEKDLLNLVVIGHVDAGKSTLMGHLLFQVGSVNKKTMHKYEQESKKLGKSSFAFAWVLDETDEERSRGVTMDVAQTRFETDQKIIILLDAPGHKDFIPNMITGAAQADVAVLVINATTGEFETGFDAGGQTREHALLARSLGVGQIIVVVNKMDTVDWSEKRYKLITEKIGQFLTRQAGFKESDISFIPCSGLSGENLVKAATEPRLTNWYKPSTTLMEQIDKLQPPQRPIDKPFRMNVSDVFKGVGTGFNVAGRVGSGYVQPADKVLIMPSGISANIRNVFIDDEPVSVAFAGDHVNLTLSGVDMANVNIGSALSDPSAPSKSARRFRAKIVIFNIEVPITKGFPVVFHYQSINEPALIKRLVSQLNRSTGEVVKKKPRCLVRNTSAVVEVELERTLCLELYSEYKDLGRFMLRQGGHTIAAGVVEEILQMKTSGASQS